jgi:hypothetical protein
LAENLSTFGFSQTKQTLENENKKKLQHNIHEALKTNRKVFLSFSLLPSVNSPDKIVLFGYSLKYISKPTNLQQYVLSLRFKD